MDAKIKQLIDDCKENFDSFAGFHTSDSEGRGIQYIPATDPEDCPDGEMVDVLIECFG